MKSEQVHIKTQKKPKFLTKAHQKNYEKGIQYIKSIEPSKIDWAKEAENQKKNASNR